MKFTFTEDQLMLCENVSTFLQKEITPDSIRSTWDTETGRSAQLWQALVDLGLTAMLVPEQYGGLGMNELDFILIAQECGRVALAEPLVETVLVAIPLLRSLARNDPRCGTLLEKIATGEIRIAIGHATNELVADAHVSDYLILPMGDQYHLVPRADVQLTRQESVDPSRRLYSVKWEPTDETCLAKGAEGVCELAASLNRGALGAAAQLVGLSQSMIDQSVKYTCERSQFGKPIGVNQALKHHLANCAVKTEFAKAPLYRAAYTVVQRPVRADFAVSHAKVIAGEAALLAAKHAIQCHGAMGYTWECDLHIWMKRAWALNQFWGPAGFHKNRLHQWLMNPNAKIGADNTFGEQL